MDVADVVDPDAEDRTAAYWVQAAINLLVAENILMKRQHDREAMATSKRRAKSKARGIGA